MIYDIIKRFRYIGIFYCFSTFDTILIIILLSFRKLNCSRISKKSTALTTSKLNQAGRPLSHLVHFLFFELIRIVSRDLECIMYFQVLLHISKTYHPIINFNISARRSLLVLYFKYVLESHVVECSMETFMHNDFRI